MVLSLFDGRHGSPADLARKRFRLESSTQILSMTSNGLPIAVVTSTTQKGEPFKACVIYYDNKAYLLAGRGNSLSAFERHRTAISSAIESFRALTDAEKKSISALEIKTITATKGMSFAELAKESPLGVNAENYLRLLNGKYPEGETVSGQLIKIVRQLPGNRLLRSA